VGASTCCICYAGPRQVRRWGVLRGWAVLLTELQRACIEEATVVSTTHEVVRGLWLRESGHQLSCLCALVG
jgi:hypothetical protein